MNQRGANASYMVKYLRYALECEKYVYVWTRASAKAEKATSDARAHTTWLKNRQAEASRQLEAAEREYKLLGVPTPQPVRAIDNDKNDLKKLKKSCSNALTLTVIIAVISLIIGFFIGSNLPSDFFPFTPSPVILAIPIGIGLFAGSFAGPICIIWYIVSLTKLKNLTAKNTQKTTGDGSSRRQSIIASGKIKDCKARLDEFPTSLSESYARERSCAKREQYVRNELAKAQRNLHTLYAEDVLPAKYRNMSSVAVLYEYLATPKYTSVFWEGGSIYSEYDKECMQKIQLRRLEEISYQLDDISDTQRMAYREMQDANRTLNSINSNLRDLESTNREIANNTAIAALASQQAAAAAQWLKNHSY